MRRLILAISMLVLLSSCSFKPSIMVLTSDGGSERYYIEKDMGLVVSFGEDFQRDLATLGNMEREEMLNDIFPYTDLFVSIGEDEYGKRQEIVSLLNDATDANNNLESFNENRKVLKDSRMIAALDELSDGFDSMVLEAMRKSCEEYRIYHADRILHGEYDYEEAKRFLYDWIDAIKR